MKSEYKETRVSEQEKEILHNYKAVFSGGEDKS